MILEEKAEEIYIKAHQDLDNNKISVEEFLFIMINNYLPLNVQRLIKYRDEPILKDTFLHKLHYLTDVLNSPKLYPNQKIIIDLGYIDDIHDFEIYTDKYRKEFIEPIKRRLEAKGYVFSSNK